MSQPPPSERRTAKRQPVYLGVELVTPDGAILSAVTKNASDGGLLLLTRSRVEPGDHVELRVLRAGTGELLVTARARIVRRETLTEDEACIWSDKVGVALDESMGEIYEELESLGAYQSKIFGS